MRTSCPPLGTVEISVRSSKLEKPEVGPRLFASQERLDMVHAADHRDVVDEHGDFAMLPK